MSTRYQERFAVHPADFRKYDTDRIRTEFLIDGIFEKDSINLVYSHYDRYIVGGAMPVGAGLTLETIDPLKSDYLLERRELGVINVGGKGRIDVDGKHYDLEYKEALYIGRGIKDVGFTSLDESRSARFYINSAPAHKDYPVVKVTLADAEKLELGSPETANARRINKLIVNGVVESCQLQMGMTELQSGSIWNTMPPHTHTRRMEAYFYFDVPDGQVVCHYMGQPNETRHIWMKNEQAVLSPPWSIHAGAGTSNYIFIWGMAGENLDYTDMDVCAPADLR
jgi:4-deoxy-L-threo-5-hexosulose-uronate ketol-isomerase